MLNIRIKSPLSVSDSLLFLLILFHGLYSDLPLICFFISPMVAIFQLYFLSVCPFSGFVAHISVSFQHVHFSTNADDLNRLKILYFLFWTILTWFIDLSSPFIERTLHLSCFLLYTVMLSDIFLINNCWNSTKCTWKAENYLTAAMQMECWIA